MTDKKKPMKKQNKKDMGGASVLVQLYNNRVLCSKVDVALDEGVVYTEIIELCAMYDFEISTASLTRYKNKRKEAIETGTPLIELLDMRKKSGNVVDLKERKNEVATKTTTAYDDTFDTVDKLYNDMELLDEVIRKGFEGLKYTDTVEVPIAIRAIETKAKITGNSMRGLTLVGLRELKLRLSAKTSAMTEVMLSYIPEEMHEEALVALEEAEKAYYSNLDLDAENQRITEALDNAGINL